LNSQPLSDEDLIRNFQNGDAQAFDEIVARYRIPLYNFIYRILGDAVFAEDLLQETFIRIWTNRHSYRAIAKFSTWIYTIAGNLAKSELRRKKVHRWLSLSIGSGSFADDKSRALEIADEEADPTLDYERKNIKQRVDKEISRLPLVFKEAIILRDIQELSYEEISIILKIPLGTVKSRVNRGRARLQKRLTDLR